MKYAAVYRTTLRSAPAVDASHSARGIWLNLLSYASEIEEMGFIRGCKSWSARALMATAMVTPEELLEAIAAGLCEWKGPDLFVHGYDVDGQKAVKKLRANGAKGGRPPKTKTEPTENQAVKGVENQAVNNPDNPSPIPTSSSLTLSNPTSSSLASGPGESGTRFGEKRAGRNPAVGQAPVVVEGNEMAGDL